MENLFIPPDSIRDDGYGWIQLIFLMAAYGYILFRASALIADGSEMLMLVLNPGLVGGLVLPVMGAVPDGAIVLFSGLGPDAQEQLKVGVGTLAGSTIMLLTIPWAACAILGRVDILKNGSQANYKPKSGQPKLSVTGWMNTMVKTGIRTPESVSAAAKIMTLTALTYLVIQGPAFAYKGEAENLVANSEHKWAIAGCVLSLAAFAGYAAYCVLSADAVERQKSLIVNARKAAVTNHLVNIVTLMQLETDLAKEEVEGRAANRSESGPGQAMLEGADAPTIGSAASKHFLRKLFEKHDTDGSGSLDKGEVKAMLVSLGLKVDSATLTALMRDVGGADHLIQFEEFEQLIKQTAASLNGGHSNPAVQVQELAKSAEGSDDEEEEDGDDDEEEEEMAGLTPFQIKTRAFATLLLGVVLVTIFSDPMVDVLSTVGKRLDISPFYVSFVVTPIVSNASELISSILQAAKKSPDSIEVTYSQLLGAATMNNTFCLSIFLILVVVKGLAWEFSAEVMAILAVEVAVMGITLTNKHGVLPIWKSLVALSLYPLSLLLVYVLENVAGWD